MEKNDNRSVFHLRKKNAYTRLGLHQRHRRHRGNSLRPGNSWEPYLHKFARQMWDKKYNKHAAHYFVTDFRAYRKTNQLGRNPFCFAISPVMIQRNVKNTQTKRPSKDKEEKFLHLYNIGSRAIFIGNLHAACNYDLMTSNGVTLVVNFTSTFTRSRGNVRFCNDGFANIHTMAFYEFVAAVTSVDSFIKQFPNDGNVIFACENGVNKSPAIAIALWILNSDSIRCDEAIDHVDNRKLQYDKNWNNLTVVKLRNFLRAFEQQKKMLFDKNEELTSEGNSN